jgi:acetoin utilization protein AcuB
MDKEPVTVAPETPMLEAIHLLRAEEVDCLPVVKDGHLIGIVTEHDFVHIAARLLQTAQSED